MTSNSIRILPEAIRSLGFASITSSYTAIGSALSNPTRIFYLLNNTDALLMFSWDGVVNNHALPAGGFLLLDIMSNKAREDGFFIAEGTKIYVKQIDAPTTGSVYLSVFYGKSS